MDLCRPLRGAERAGANPLVVDLRRIGFVDSTGLMALFRAHERARAEGRRFAEINSTGPAHRLFQITNADQIIDVLEDAEGIGSPAPGD